MNEGSLHYAAYKGNKEIRLQDVPVAKATGFGAAADDYMERGIDLNEQLITNKHATFFFRMISDAMTGDSINNGDILIVDRSRHATSGNIIVASFEGELLVRRLSQLQGVISLLSSNPVHAAININGWNAYTVWGVVTYVIHSFS